MRLGRIETIGSDETDISYPCSNVAALSCSYAVWIFHAGEVCDDGGIWCAGISILSAQQGSGTTTTIRQVGLVSTNGSSTLQFIEANTISSFVQYVGLAIIGIRDSCCCASQAIALVAAFTCRTAIA